MVKAAARATDPMATPTISAPESSQPVLSLSLDPSILPNPVLGDAVGENVGDVVGDSLGVEVGLEVGDLVGLEVGLEVGDSLGLDVGLEVGDSVGLEVGLEVGDSLGLRVGELVGGTQSDTSVDASATVVSPISHIKQCSANDECPAR